MFRTISVSVLIVLIFSPFASADPVLRVYGPGGPAEPMKECARIFGERNDIEVSVTAGPESQWLEQAKSDADLFFGGAEYMLTQLAERNPALVDLSTRTSLWIRPIGILVRKGNPRRIRGMADLAKPGTRIIEVAGAGQVGAWEDLAGDLIPAIQKNTVVSVPTTAAAIEKWKNDRSLDAWVNFESWHYRLREETDLVRIQPRFRIYRGTPVAVAAAADQKELALAFIRFLQSAEAHAVFRKWGWK